MTLPDQGTPVGRRDVTNSNNPPTGPADAASDAAGYGHTSIAGSMFAGFVTPQPASHMAHQPVYSPMAGYAIQESGAAWPPAQQSMQTEKPAPMGSIDIQQHQHHQQHQVKRPAGLALNWLSHFACQIPTGPSTPSTTSGTSYVLSPGYNAGSPSLAGTSGTEHAFVQEQPFQSNTQQEMQLAQDQPLHLGNSNGVAMQNDYGFMANSNHQMMSMVAAINAQEQQMQAMISHQAMENIADNQPSAHPPGTGPVPAWLATHNQPIYYSQFGYGNVRGPSMGYMQAMPASANGTFSGSVQLPPAYISGRPTPNGIADIGHSLMQQPQQQQQLTPLPPSYLNPVASFTRPMEDETLNEERRKFVRTDSGASDAFASRSSSVKVHGFSHAPHLAATTDSSTTPAHLQGWNTQAHPEARLEYFAPSQDTSGFQKMEHLTRLYDTPGSPLPKIPETPKHEPPPLRVASTEIHMSDAVSLVEESETGEDVDAICISPFRRRSLSAAVSVECSDDWTETAKITTATQATPKPLATVPENSQLGADKGDMSSIGTVNMTEVPVKAKETPVPAPAAIPTPSSPRLPDSISQPPSETQPQFLKPSTGKQKMQFIHMDAAGILMSSHSFFPEEHHESGTPIKPVKFRPAGNAPIKVRKWSTVVYPPPPESGYGSMSREVDFDHSASNVFLQHQASPVAPSSVTSRFKEAPALGTSKSKLDSSGSPSLKPVRTLNWRPSDDRIFTAAAGFPPKTTSKTTAKIARQEEKKKAAAAEEAKVGKSADMGLPDAEDDDEPMSVTKALAALSSKRGRPALTTRVARPKQVRKRTEESASKPDSKAAKTAQASKTAADQGSAT